MLNPAAKDKSAFEPSSALCHEQDLYRANLA
jgi:hypothetical protein